MGHQPVVIGRIPVKAAPHLVIDSPERHLVERQSCHLQRLLVTVSNVVPEEKIDHHARRELGSRTETPVTGVKTGRDLTIRVIEHFQIEPAARCVSRRLGVDSFDHRLRIG